MVNCNIWSCKIVNWSRSFNRYGYSNCGTYEYYMNGMWRNDNAEKYYGTVGAWDGINRIEWVRCCKRPMTYWNKATSCIIGDWLKALDK